MPSPRDDDEVEMMSDIELSSDSVVRTVHDVEVSYSIIITRTDCLVQVVESGERGVAGGATFTAKEREGLCEVVH